MFLINVEDIGYPIRVCELLSTLVAPYYIERVSLLTSADIIKAKKAVEKAIRYNKENRGFTFVEFISTCPTNWGYEPEKARQWAKENMLPFFKPGVFRDKGEGVGGAVVGTEDPGGNALMDADDIKRCSVLGAVLLRQPVGQPLDHLAVGADQLPRAFVLGIGGLVLGVVLMLVLAALPAHRLFFRGQALNRGTAVLVPEDAG